MSPLASTLPRSRAAGRVHGRLPGAAELPGLRFESRPPAARDELPPMDVAAFVGFASAGPVGLPVAVEDMAHFRDLFGADPVLGHDPDLGRPMTSHLGASVAAFFRGGGRRCHVLRVADARAQRHRFPLPGLCLLDDAAHPWDRGPVELPARAVGTWATGLRVGAGAG
ncbi:MAG: hypothetical protein MI919_28285, partial [Holophagales bacterium]|nr:hypothetical protein [Holophagales bacterium]